jgi:hypothetical protein
MPAFCASAMSAQIFAAWRPPLFRHSSAVPSLWSAVANAASVTVSPGASASVSVTVTPPPTAPNGTYNVDVTAPSSDGSRAASARVTCSLSTTLAAAVKTDKPSYSSGQAVNVTTSVSAGGLACPGVSINVTVTKPDGAKVTQSLVTGSDGKGTYVYRPAPKDPTGTYSASSVATLDVRSAAGSAAFQVTAPASKGKK